TIDIVDGAIGCGEDGHCRCTVHERVEPCLVPGRSRPHLLQFAGALPECVTRTTQFISHLLRGLLLAGQCGAILVCAALQCPPLSLRGEACCVQFQRWTPAG